MTKAQLRRARLDRRNEYQRAYRLRPGRREADALASRKSYWKKRKPYFANDYQASCTCQVCTSIRGYAL